MTILADTVGGGYLLLVTAGLAFLYLVHRFVAWMERDDRRCRDRLARRADLDEISRVNLTGLPGYHEPPAHGESRRAAA